MHEPEMGTKAPQDSRARRGHSTRQRLLRAGLELCAEDGFRAATTARIAERSGVAEGTIYRHFAGKDALLNEAYRGALRWGLGLVEELASDRALGARDLLIRLGRSFARGAERDPATFRMMVTEGMTPYLEDRSLAARAEFHSAVEQIVARGKSDGLVRAGPAELWAAVWLALAGFAGERVCRGEWEADHPMVGLSLEAAWDAIAARSP